MKKNKFFQNLTISIARYLLIGYENFTQREKYLNINTFEYIVGSIFYQKIPKKNNITQEYTIWLKISETTLLQDINIYDEIELLKVITKELRFCSKYLDYSESMELPIGIYGNNELILIFRKSKSN